MFATWSSFQKMVDLYFTRASHFILLNRTFQETSRAGRRQKWLNKASQIYTASVVFVTWPSLEKWLMYTSHDVLITPSNIPRNFPGGASTNWLNRQGQPYVYRLSSGVVRHGSSEKVVGNYVPGSSQKLLLYIPLIEHSENFPRWSTKTADKASHTYSST